MIYQTNALSFSLLLGAGSIAISAAASLAYDDPHAVYHKDSEDIISQMKAPAMHRQRSRFRRSVAQSISRSLLNDLTGSPDEAQDIASDLIDSESSAHTGSPAGIDLNDPVGSITDWLNHEERIYNTLGLKGELSLVAPSDEKPMGVKIGTLGYAPDSSAHTPFELLSESEAGSTVFLTPPEPTVDQTKERLDPSAGFSNNPTSILIARSSPLGLGLLPNMNLTGADSVTASGATEPSGFVHVLIRAGSPSSPGSLCATFYVRSAPNHTEDDAPMFLEPCDNTFIPGSSANLDGFTATQLWQYDPETYELKPVLKREPGTGAKSTLPSALDQNHPIAPNTAVGEATISQPLGSSTEGTRTTTFQSATAAQQTQSCTSNSIIATYSSIVAPSQARVRRDGNDRIEANVPLPSSFTTVAIVEPYTLVFAPRITSGTGAMVPDSPV